MKSISHSKVKNYFKIPVTVMTRSAYPESPLIDVDVPGKTYDCGGERIYVDRLKPILVDKSLFRKQSAAAEWVKTNRELVVKTYYGLQNSAYPVIDGDEKPLWFCDTLTTNERERDAHWIPQLWQVRAENPKGYFDNPADKVVLVRGAAGKKEVFCSLDGWTAPFRRYIAVKATSAARETTEKSPCDEFVYAACPTGGVEMDFFIYPENHFLVFGNKPDSSELGFSKMTFARA